MCFEGSVGYLTWVKKKMYMGRGVRFFFVIMYWDIEMEIHTNIVKEMKLLFLFFSIIVGHALDHLGKFELDYANSANFFRTRFRRFASKH